MNEEIFTTKNLTESKNKAYQKHAKERNFKHLDYMQGDIDFSAGFQACINYIYKETEKFNKRREFGYSENVHW